MGVDGPKLIKFHVTLQIEPKTQWKHENWVEGYHPSVMGELCFGGRWTPKLTKGPYNSSNWVEGYEIVTDKYTL